MLSPEQINEIHRLHLVEKWSQRRIARHLRGPVVTTRRRGGIVQVFDQGMPPSTRS